MSGNKILIVKEFASEGKVPGFKVGSAGCFKKAEFEVWIKRQPEG